MTEKYKHVAPWKPEEPRDIDGEFFGGLWFSVKAIAFLALLGFAGWALFMAFIMPIARLLY